MLVKEGELDRIYAPLFQRLHLPQEKMKALRALMAQRTQQCYDAKALAKTAGMGDLCPSEATAIEKVATVESDLLIEQLLGAEAFTKFQRYEKNKGWIYECTPREAGYLGMDSLVPKPLTPEEETRIDALAESLQALEKRLMPGYDDDCYFAGETLPRSEAFLKEATKILPPEKAEELRFRTLLSQNGVLTDNILRSAAYAGKLRLSKSSLKYYGQPKKADAPAIKKEAQP